MKDRINKPKVFLSHSKRDREFVRKVRDDLNRCQIQSWFDEDDIRDGEPWLDAIFEDGIPGCDAVIVFLTENSIDSNMVRKELNASLVQQLKDSSVRLLPYVSDSALRPKLRPDIASLQCRVWNQENYADMLPSVIAEIWRSFLERTIGEAILLERGRRSELEKELVELRGTLSDKTFSSSEESEFEYIFKQLNLEVIAKLETGDYQHKTKEQWRLSFLVFLHKLLLEYEGVPSDMTISSLVIHEIYPKIQSWGVLYLEPDLIPMLRRYGLVKTEILNDEERTWEKNHFTDKMHRFFYWIERSDKLALSKMILGKVDETPTS